MVGPVTFGVEPGEMLALVGPNGAGKSSLLRCLYRFHRPIAGSVQLDGKDIWKLPAKDCARRIATVLQEPVSDFGLTVAEIVELGLTPHMERRAKTDDGLAPVDLALELMQLNALAGRDFATLSGGEKQRVMIARALVQRPDLLILDEPTNHLDIRHQLEVLELVRGLACTTIVSLHDLGLAAAHADRVLVLEQGKLVEIGAPLSVLTRHSIRRTFAVETEIDSHPATGRPRFSFHL